MNRDIRFRAWSSELNAMSNPFPFESIRNDVSETGFLRAYVLLKVAVKITLRSAYLDQCDVMQFTGLQDGSGVDIFEGDLFCYGALPDIFKIEFVDGCFSYNSKISGYIPLKNLAKNGINQIRIVGNIHENPELI